MAKCIRGDVQSLTGSKFTLKGGSFMVAPFSNSTNLLAQPPNHSGKMKLQFFPIDEAIQKVLQQVIISVSCERFVQILHTMFFQVHLSSLRMAYYTT